MFNKFTGICMEQQIRAKLNPSEERVFLVYLREFNIPYPQNFEGLKAIIDNRTNALNFYEGERRKYNSYVGLNPKGEIETTIFNFEGFTRRTPFEEVLIKVFDALNMVLIEAQNRVDTEKLKGLITINTVKRPKSISGRIKQIVEEDQLNENRTYWEGESVTKEQKEKLYKQLSDEGYKHNSDKIKALDNISSYLMRVGCSKAQSKNRK